jgi:uncharacterized protein (TIGR02246 family)
MADETGVLDVFAALEQAWAEGDADAFGALHGPDATYVAFDGTVMTGPAQIADGHRALFAGIMKGSRLAVVHRDLRFTAPDAALVVQRAGIIMRWQKSRSTPSSKRLSTNTTLLRSNGGRWTVVAFQNTRYHPWAATLTGRLMTRLSRG